jgi:dipeptidase
MCAFAMKVFSLLTSVGACTVFGATPGATVESSTIITHSDDGEPNLDARLLFVPAKDHPAGSVREIFFTPESFPRFVGADRGPDFAPTNVTGPPSKPIGSIPQVSHTYAYHDSTMGVINEHGVAVGESTCSSAFFTCARGKTTGCEDGRKVGSALMSIDTLSELAMERTRTARDAVELMGSLASEHGYYGLKSFEGGGESLTVGDRAEVWVFQILSDPSGTSAIWAAQRIPDGEAAVVANMFTIREIPRNASSDSFLLSPNIFSVAEERGWIKPGSSLDFTRTYSDGEYDHKYYSGRRMWGGLRLLSPSAHFPSSYGNLRYDVVYPVSVKPDKKLAVTDFFRAHRDWYQGTEFDMTKGVAAGPFGSPDRFAVAPSVKGHWERSIALYRTTAVLVSQLGLADASSGAVANVMWYGAGAAHYAPFLPVPAGTPHSLYPLRIAYPHDPAARGLNWAVRRLSDVCQIRWDRMHAIVEKEQRKVEAAGAEHFKQWTTDYLRNGHDAAELGRAAEAFANATLARWTSLADELVVTLSENTDVATFTPLGYPSAWLKAVGYADGPPAPPPLDQCPPVCSSTVLV